MYNSHKLIKRKPNSGFNLNRRKYINNRRKHRNNRNTERPQKNLTTYIVTTAILLTCFTSCFSPENVPVIMASQIPCMAMLNICLIHMPF